MEDPFVSAHDVPPTGCCGRYLVEIIFPDRSARREGVIAEVRVLSKDTPSETILILKIFKLTKKNIDLEKEVAAVATNCVNFSCDIWTANILIMVSISLLLYTTAKV